MSHVQYDLDWIASLRLKYIKETPPPHPLNFESYMWKKRGTYEWYLGACNLIVFNCKERMISVGRKNCPFWKPKVFNIFKLPLYKDPVCFEFLIWSISGLVWIKVISKYKQNTKKIFISFHVVVTFVSLKFILYGSIFKIKEICHWQFIYKGFIVNNKMNNDII